MGEETAERLTDANQAFTEEHIISEPEELQFQTADGLTIHGWLIKPAQYEKGNTYPLILEVHGGPHAMYANAYFHEFQVLAAKGSAVVYVNPRGSHGYGQDFVNRVRGDYGGGDFKDVMAAVDHALGQYDFIDQERLGITGGSYGGFMTNWAVGHTNRFKAAVTQRSISNWISFYGVSDIGYFSQTGRSERTFLKIPANCGSIRRSNMRTRWRLLFSSSMANGTTGARLNRRSSCLRH